MKVSLDWISDFVDLPKGLSDREIAEGLTLGLCEVEGLERPGAVFQSVAAAKVTAVKKHPKADKLKLAAVDLGGGKSVTVVCGAPNCRPGITVPYAPVGTTLPGGLTLEPKTIRGILSEGMLCSEEELGLSEGPGPEGPREPVGPGGSKGPGEPMGAEGPGGSVGAEGSGGSGSSGSSGGAEGPGVSGQPGGLEGSGGSGSSEGSGSLGGSGGSAGPEGSGGLGSSGDSGGSEGPGGRGGIMELPEGTPAGTKLSDLPEILGRGGGPGAGGPGAEGPGPGNGPGAGGPGTGSGPGAGAPGAGSGPGAGGPGAERGPGAGPPGAEGPGPGNGPEAEETVLSTGFGGEGPATPAAADDLILDIDNKSLTHRPDCWGHYGLAREFAAIFSRPFRDRFSPEWAASLKERIRADGAAGTAGGPGEGPGRGAAGDGSARPGGPGGDGSEQAGGPAESGTEKGPAGGPGPGEAGDGSERPGGPGAAGTGEAPVSVHVDPDSSNLGFLGLSINIDPGVSAGVSPPWMRRRLKAAGMRPINAVVDISNYVMLETGIPNHIFDRAAIRGGRIVVRRAGADQDFTTLDGQKRRVLASDTLVCDAERPLAAAGVMGGLESSVGADTTAIMVEAANWKDSEVRRTAARLGLRTDASQRYEKSLDSARLEICLLRIYELIRKISPGARAAGGIQRENMPEPPGLVIPTSPGRIAAVLGEEVGEERLEAILGALGFGLDPIGASAPKRPRGDCRDFTHRVQVPTWRSTKDIECEADIAEEVGRIIGYDNITPESPSQGIAALRLSPAKTMFRRAQDYMVLRGRALEVMTYPLVGRALLEKAAWPALNENLVLANALTPAHDRMRPGMIPSLLEAAAENNKEHSVFRIFECGRAYADLGGEDYSREHHQIGIVFQELHANPFIPLADTVENLLPYLGLRGKLIPGDPARQHPLIPAAWPGTHPHEFLDIVIGKTSEGAVVSIHPQIARAFKLRGKTALAVIDLTDLGGQSGAPAADRAPFIPPDRFPGSDFDLTVVMPSRTHAAEAVEAVRSMGKKEIRSVGVLDVFPLEEDRKALTLHIEFRDSEHTLDADFIKKTEGEIIAVLDGAGYPLRNS